MADKIDLRQRSSAVVDIGSDSGTIHPFAGNNGSLLQTIQRELFGVLAEPQGKKIGMCLAANVICTVVLLLWCSSTNSMALTAFSYLTIFDILSLLSCLVTLWVAKQKSSPLYSFGYGRFEVLAVFGSTLLAQLGALFVVKESVERMVQQPEVHTGRLLLGTLLAALFHLFVTYSVDNKAFNHVVSASSSSWLQEHVADMSESLCHVVPGLSKLLLPRINPFSLIAFAGGFALLAVYVLIDMNQYYAADTWVAVWIALMTCGTMFPMSVYSGKILLQTTPSYILGQLDKVLREASTLDGVLEFRHEHFWTLAFGTMAGSVHVRIRRDADEQLVLAHVVNRLSNLIQNLTIQVFKDDWSRASAYQIISDSNLPSSFPGAAGSPLRLPMVNTDSNAILTTIGKLHRSPLNPMAGGLPYANVPSIQNNWMPGQPTMPYGASVGPRASKTNSAPNPSFVPPPATRAMAGAYGPLAKPPMAPMLAQTYGVDLTGDRTVATGRLPPPQTAFSLNKDPLRP